MHAFSNSDPNCIQSMQFDIDTLMEHLQSNQRTVATPQSEHLLMLIEDINSTNMQTSTLSKESEQLNEMLYSQSDYDAVLTRAQMKRILDSLNGPITTTKQVSLNLKQQLIDVEKDIENVGQIMKSIQESNQNYNDFINKFKESQKQCDQQLLKQLGQSAYTTWNKLKIFFDAEIIQTSVPLGLLIKLQILILRLFEPDHKQEVLENIKLLIIEINSGHPLIVSAYQIDQLIPILTKYNLHQQITKCLNQMHSNFCQLAQVFNQHNISYQLSQQVQKEISQQNQQIKQLQYKKSHLMIEMEKHKKQQKELQTQLAQLEKQVEKQIEMETQHLLMMYLKDKEQLIAEIKKKYGKRYYDNMINDIKKEFSKICLTQQHQYDQSIEDAFQRVECINKKIINNKIKNQQLVQQYSQQKFKQVSSQIFSINGVDKREYLLELQQCKIQLLQIENKIQRKIIIENMPDILQQIQYHINDIKLRIQANSIPQKARSDSIDALIRSNRTIEHHRSQSQAPLQSPRLLSINLPISNPLEIFDSNESNTSKDQHSRINKRSDDSNQSRVTKRDDDSSVSINNENTNVTNLSNKQISSCHQSQIQKKPILKEVGNILSNCDQIHNSLKSSRAKKESSIKTEIKFDIMVYLQIEPTQMDYDPIINYEQDPAEFGYQLFRMDQQFNLYICEQETNMKDLKEMLNSFNKHFSQLNDIKSVEINNCSLNALKFQNIYECSLRQACVESLALRHLRVRFFPFLLIGGAKHHKGLATRKDDVLESQPIRNLSKEVKAANKLQRWFRAREDVKFYQKMKKKNRYRKNVIAEIVNTERQYVEDLKIICEKVKKQAQQQIPEQVQAIFMNCDELYQWNYEFLRVMELGYKGCDATSKPYKAVFEGNYHLLMDPKVYGFRCYFDYCSKFTKSNQTIDKLKTSDQRFKQLMIAVSSDLRGMDLASFLVKPVQRLPKYILLFKDLEKHTDEDYADCKSIKFLHKYFRDVNEENNKTMDIFLGRLQIAQMCDQLKINKDELLSDATRTYKFEDKISIIQAEKEQLVQVHALNDMILITNNTSVLLSVRLDSLSFVKNQADSKYFSNLFQIVGVGETVQCLAETPAAKIKSMEQFEKLIQANREEEFNKRKKSGKDDKMRYPVQVVVVGTEERNFQSFQKHTQYITEISINKVYQNIYIRFSEVVAMNEKYRKKYPTIEFPLFPSQSWLAYQKTKSIEERKFVIEGFLQTLLQAEEVQKDNELLNDLKLPYNFYDLPKIQQTQMKSVVNKHSTSLEGLDYLAENAISIQKLRMSAGEILKAAAVEKKQRRTNVSSIIPNRVVAWHEKMATDPNISKVTITMPDGQQTLLGIDDRARVSEVLRSAAGFNQLAYYRDFRLYMIDRLKKQRVLDEDEILRKVVNDERENSSGVLDKLEQWVTGSSNGVIFKFRKYIYMPIQLEEFDYREDPVRLMYLAFSIIDDVYDNKLQLGFKDYCLFSALYYHMKYSEKIEMSMNNLQLDKIRKVIPPEVYSGKQDSEWRNLTLQIIKELDIQLNEISQQNRRDLLQRKEGAVLKQIDKRGLAAQVTLNAARQFPQANMAIFQVQTFQATQDYFKKFGIEVHATMYLGFSVHKIHFLNPQRKTEFRVIDYSKVKQVKSYPNQVVFEFSIFSELLRFDTFQSYEIKLLVEQYQDIQRFYLEYELGELFDIKQ